MRKVILDTETTGLDFTCDRIFEIACVEMLDYELTGNIFHYYLNPQKRLSEESIAITNMNNEYLENKPFFSHIAHEFLEFIHDTVIVAHNANFDLQMINAELRRCNLPNLNNTIIDTLEIARKTYPGGNNSLDSLCKKFKVNHNRNYHGALKDARDLSGVYYYLMNAYGIKNSNIQNDLLPTLDTIEETVIYNFNRINPSILSAEDNMLHTIFCKTYGIE